MRYLPIELDVSGRVALVVGAGAEAISKVDRLLAAGARVTVVATGAIDARVREEARAGRLALFERGLEDADLADACVVFVEPGDDVLSERVLGWARRTGRPVCTLDRPELSTFANPAVVDIHGLTIALGSSGSSPGTLRRIREDLTTLFSDARFERWLATLRSLRERIPRGDRARRMAAAVVGFGVEAKLVFPAWFERGDDPPE